MELLNIFSTGGLTLAITLIFALGEFWFVKQMIEHAKAEGTKWYKNPFRWFALGLLVVYAVALIAIGSDYKGV